MTTSDVAPQDMPKGDAYHWLALQAIRFANDADELRKWWRDENRKRDHFGLTEDQNGTLIDACKAKIEELGDKPKDQKKKQQDRRRARRRAAI
jgi:hypothetical protein